MDEFPIINIGSLSAKIRKYIKHTRDNLFIGAGDIFRSYFEINETYNTSIHQGIPEKNSHDVIY